VDDETDIDELGPVDWIVVEFPGSKFNGEIAPALADLVERDLVRVLDLLVLKKESDGTLEAFELSDLDDAEIGGFRSHEQELAMLLSEEDVTAVAAAVEPGSSAAVLVWENKWAAPFGAACATQVASSWPAAGSPSKRCWPRSRPTTNRTSERRREMPLARRRMRRAAVIGPAPVARTAATVATAAVVTRGRPAS
jgi:hypothetical protein